MEVLGIDIGFGFTKATNGKDTLIFKSLFGDASDLQFWMDIGSQSASDFYHVTVDGKSYFIGDLAEQQSNVLNFTLDQEKLISEFVKILALTAAGVTHEFHRYDGAGHAFQNFPSPERYREAQSEDAWAKVLDFMKARLSA